MDHEKRQIYEKPVLRVIELAAEETMGNPCKTASGGLSGHGIPDCHTANCLTVGS